MIPMIFSRSLHLQCRGPEVLEPCVNPFGSVDVVLATVELAPAGDGLLNLVPSLPREVGPVAVRAAPLWGARAAYERR